MRDVVFIHSFVFYRFESPIACDINPCTTFLQYIMYKFYIINFYDGNLFNKSKQDGMTSIQPVAYIELHEKYY